MAHGRVAGEVLGGRRAVFRVVDSDFVVRWGVGKAVVDSNTSLSPMKVVVMPVFECIGTVTNDRDCPKIPSLS